MHSETQNKKTPFLQWYQNEDYVIIDFNQYNLKEKNFFIEKNDFSLNSTLYEMKFTLFDTIELVEYKVRHDNIRILLKKKEKTFWKYLNSDSLYKKQIQVNWDQWKDEDEEEDVNEDDINQMDFSQMMSSMNPDQGLEGNIEETEEEEESENHDIGCNNACCDDEKLIEETNDE